MIFPVEQVLTKTVSQLSYLKINNNNNKKKGNVLIHTYLTKCEQVSINPSFEIMVPDPQTLCNRICTKHSLSETILNNLKGLLGV